MTETTADVNVFNQSSTNSSELFENPTHMPTLRVKENRLQPVFRKNSRIYDMSGEKYLCIFNHRIYRTTKYYKEKPSTREGTNADVKRLSETFGRLGYNVTVHNDLDYREIMDTVSMLSNADHSTTSCVCIVVLTHGLSGGIVCATDRPYSLENIMNLLQNGNEYLVGKPKLIFVQACRGGHTDDGRQVQTDSSENIVLPTHSDCLIMYSSYPNYLSFRDCFGSWLIQALCDVIDEDENQDIFQIIIQVNAIVAEKTTYNKNQLEIHNKKQIPETKFTLRKAFYFI